MVTTRSQSKKNSVAHKRPRRKTVEKTKQSEQFKKYEKEVLRPMGAYLGPLKERTIGEGNIRFVCKKRRQPFKSTVVKAAKDEFSAAFNAAAKDPSTKGLKTYKGVLDGIFAAANAGTLASRYGLDGDTPVVLAW